MKKLLLTFLSLFLLVELAIAQSGLNEPGVSHKELSKTNNAETSIRDTGRINDSLKYIALIAEIAALRKQLKAKSDTNQAQIDRLKVDLEKVKGGEKMAKRAPNSTEAILNDENTILLAKLFVKFDSCQVQINQLKSKLKKANDLETATANERRLNDSLSVVRARTSDDMFAQLNAKSDNNQTQIDQLKVENARTKISGTITPANTDNASLIAQLKTKSDNNQAQIDQLKRELENTKTVGKTLLANTENDALIAQLKAKTDDNQIQVDQLRLELENMKTVGKTPAANTENDALIAQLFVKFDTNQAQIDRLKINLEKVKSGEKKTKRASNSTEPVLNDANTILLEKLFVKFDSNQVQMDRLKQQLAKVQTSETAIEEDRRVKDSLLRQFLIGETESLPTQLKTKSNTNQRQFDQLKAKSDNNQTQIDQLKQQLAKAQNSETAIGKDRRVKDSVLRHFLISETEALLTQLKTKSDMNQRQFDQLKMELENMKTVGKTPPANTENDALIAQLKAQSDTNQAQIDRLKINLEKEKGGEKMAKRAPNPTEAVLNDENTILLAKLFVKFDTNQAQIDQLKQQLAKAQNSETAIEKDRRVKDSVLRHFLISETEALLTQLKTKSDMNQRQFDQLKEELSKTKEEVVKSANLLNSKKPPLVSGADNTASYTALKAKSDSDKAEIKRLISVVSSTVEVSSSKTDAFIDEKGKPASEGFYVVIGAFGNKENADRFKATNIIKGHANTKMIQNQVTKIYNIFVWKTNNKKDADSELTKYKEEYNGVWILKLE